MKKLLLLALLIVSSRVIAPADEPTHSLGLDPLSASSLSLHDAASRALPLNHSLLQQGIDFSQLSFYTWHSGGSWIWERHQPSGKSQRALWLNADNQLHLYDQRGELPAIFLNPLGPSLFATPVLVDSDTEVSGDLTVHGALILKPQGNLLMGPYTQSPSKE